jgi:hypothetical protein
MRRRSRPRLRKALVLLASFLGISAPGDDPRAVAAPRADVTAPPAVRRPVRTRITRRKGCIVVTGDVRDLVLEKTAAGGPARRPPRHLSVEPRTLVPADDPDLEVVKADEPEGEAMGERERETAVPLRSLAVAVSGVVIVYLLPVAPLPALRAALHRRGVLAPIETWLPIPPPVPEPTPSAEEEPPRLPGEQPASSSVAPAFPLSAPPAPFATPPPAPFATPPPAPWTVPLYIPRR